METRAQEALDQCYCAVQHYSKRRTRWFAQKTRSPLHRQRLDVPLPIVQPSYILIQCLKFNICSISKKTTINTAIISVTYSDVLGLIVFCMLWPARIKAIKQLVHA